MASDLKSIKYFLLDMDGTIYLENELFDGTLDFLTYLKEHGKHAMYITNNSSKSVDTYIEKLASLGIDSTAEDFCTSADATAFFLQKEFPKGKIFLLGTPSLEQYLTEKGFTLIKEYSEEA